MKVIGYDVWARDKRYAEKKKTKRGRKRGEEWCYWQLTGECEMSRGARVVQNMKDFFIGWCNVCVIYVE